MYVHLTDTDLTGDSTIGRVENTTSPITVERIQEWLGDPAARIMVTSVAHSGEQIHSDAYEIPDRLIRQIELTELTCVFPWCDKPTLRCDKDHEIPYSQGGQACSHHLAPLCRTHHLLKTHTGWRYERLDPEQDRGTSAATVDLGPNFVWTSPYDHRYRRSRLGTTTADPPDNSS